MMERATELTDLAHAIGRNATTWLESTRPLGERSANAIEAGHLAIKDIDRLLVRLYEVRAELVGELVDDERIRMARPIPRIPRADP